MGIIDQAWEKRLAENSDGGMPVQELAKGVLEMGKLAYAMGWQDCARQSNGIAGQKLKCAIELLKRAQSDLIAMDFDDGNCADLVAAIDNFVAVVNASSVSAKLYPE
jgi:hypothetical protein